jgi:hypothetical protein
VQPISIAGQTGPLYEMSGQNPSSGDKTAILAAILRKEGTAWFFKIVGDTKLVEQQKETFVGYLKNFDFATKPADASAQTPELPPNHPPLSVAARETAPPRPNPDRPKWNVPAGWREIDGGQFLIGKFIIVGADNSQASVNVSMSAGDGGGLAGNVNRWRRQLGLNEVAAPEIQKSVKAIDAGAAKATLVELEGIDAQTGKAARLVAMVVPGKSETWFYKLMGAMPVVDREKDNFIKFVQSTKYEK